MINIKTNYKQKYYKYTPVPIDESRIAKALNRAKRNYEIVKRAFEGENYKSIGEDYGISKQRVEQIIRKLSIN